MWRSIRSVKPLGSDAKTWIDVHVYISLGRAFSTFTRFLYLLPTPCFIHLNLGPIVSPSEVTIPMVKVYFCFVHTYL